METVGHWLPVGSEGKQGGSSNDQWSPGECEAVSRRAAALLLTYGPLKESKNSDAVVTERYSIVRLRSRAVTRTRRSLANGRTVEDAVLAGPS